MFAADILKAVGAGVISFLSPCVLPLVPAYLSFVSGVSLDEMKAGGTATRKVAWRALAFILGFTVVFVALGASATAVGSFLAQNAYILLRIAGVLLVIFGLHMTGILRIGLLYRERRAQVKSRPAGFLGAAVVGVAFAFGWSPCIGPFLAGILALAAKKEHLVEGMALLAAYSAGLGMPLFFAAVATERFLSMTAAVKKHFRFLEMIAGAILIVAGVSIFFGRLGRWSAWLNEVTGGKELWTGVLLYYVVGLALAVWVIQDARRRAVAAWPWAMAAVVLGPAGAIAYRMAVGRSQPSTPLRPG